jgi:hypothetical protein
VRTSKVILIILLSLAASFASASDEQYAWINQGMAESYCAQVNSKGVEVGMVSFDHCSLEGLKFKWYYVVAGFVCSLGSNTNEYFHVLVDNKYCGVPANAYYQWQRRGLGDDDFGCAMRVKGNDILYVYVQPSFCGR